MPNHSPAPWRVKAVPGDPYFDQVEDANGRVVASMNVNDSCVKAGANAELIAAAPDLLEAGWSLATWAAAINWTEDGMNTADWLEGLRFRIGAFQDLAEKLR